MVLNEEMKNWITTWDGMLTYYMERENTPDDPEDREVYYRKAKEFLADRLTEVWRFACNYSAQLHSDAGVPQREGA